MSTLLQNVAKFKAPAASEKTPSVVVPELQAHTRELQDVKAAIKDFTARKETLEADIAAVAEPRRVELSRKLGQSLTSIKINGMSYVTFANSMKNISEDEYAQVLQVFGQERADLYFRRVYSIQIDPHQLPEALLQQLLDLGAEVQVTVKQTKQLHQDATLKPEIQALAEQCPAAKPVRQYK